MTSNTNISEKLLPNHIDFFRAHVNQKLMETFSELIYTTLIFSELLPNYTYFSEFIDTNTDIFRELLPNYTYFI